MKWNIHVWLKSKYRQLQSYPVFKLLSIILSQLLVNRPQLPSNQSYNNLSAGLSTPSSKIRCHWCFIGSTVHNSLNNPHNKYEHAAQSKAKTIKAVWICMKNKLLNGNELACISMIYDHRLLKLPQLFFLHYNQLFYTLTLMCPTQVLRLTAFTKIKMS
jgi:hypothetical protein